MSDTTKAPVPTFLTITPSVSSRIGRLKVEILSWPRIVELVEELGLGEDARKSELAFRKYITQVRRRISVRTRGPVLTISFYDEDPQVTQKVANTLADIFIRRTEEMQALETNTAIDFIADVGTNGRGNVYACCFATDAVHIVPKDDATSKQVLEVGDGPQAILVIQR